MITTDSRVITLPTVAVIVPCFNAAPYLEATVISIEAQTRSDWECVLVDDGSTDETPAVMQALCARSPRIRTVHQPNAGRAKACNLGVHAVSASVQFLFFLDSDDLLEPTALESMTRYLEAHSAVGLVACGFDEIDGSGRFVRNGVRSRWVPGVLWPRRLTETEHDTPFVAFFCATGQGPYALFRRSVFDRTHGFEETLSRFSAHEDTDIFCQMALEAPVHFIPDCLYKKRVHDGQVTSQGWRIFGAYEVFRQKWDHVHGRHAAEQRMLDAARRHYERRHKPFRFLKVAALAFRDWCASPSRARWSWFVDCLVSAARGLFS